MKIEINRIPTEGLVLSEEFKPAKLDLEADVIKFASPIKVEALVSKITNAVTVQMSIAVPMKATCSRCLADFEIDFKEKITLNYPVDSSELSIDLDPDIREEIMLNCPLKPLCKLNCKGLCQKCGKNLNEGGCTCGST